MSLAQPATELLLKDFSQSQLRQALGLFATGVTVVTACGADGERVGLTASSFNSVSMHPPLVLWSLSRLSHSMQVFESVSHYAIHVLGADQLALGERFAGPREQRWTGLPHGWSPHGCPLLDGCLAVFECSQRSRHAEGDHVIFVGQVEACRSGSGPLLPLLYHRGQMFPHQP
jgi:flavin reductase (DIM6/NTAB) family NADH-FMN oxidoreductase RutF